jgi:hypothetical protein
MVSGLQQIASLALAFKLEPMLSLVRVAVFLAIFPLSRFAGVHLHALVMSDK